MPYIAIFISRRGKTPGWKRSKSRIPPIRIMTGMNASPRNATRPNTASRILNSKGTVTDIVNNYSKISFNFGPTLLSWMADKSAKVYEAIIEADRQSVSRTLSGHGNAIAQVYNHMIMPLANERDKDTQVLWGIRDFESAVRPLPGGMWLAETAVDFETLESWPRRASSSRSLRRTRPKPSRRWTARTGRMSRAARSIRQRPYLCHLPSGRSIAIFFYDGPVSRGVAFEDLLENGRESCANGCCPAFPTRRRLAAARAYRHRRRDVRPPSPVRRHGARVCPALHRDKQAGNAHQLRGISREISAESRSGDHTRIPRGVVFTASSAGAMTAAAIPAGTRVEAGVAGPAE